MPTNWIETSKFIVTVFEDFSSLHIKQYFFTIYSKYRTYSLLVTNYTTLPLNKVQKYNIIEKLKKKTNRTSNLLKMTYLTRLERRNSYNMAPIYNDESNLTEILILWTLSWIGTSRSSRIWCIRNETVHPNLFTHHSIQ